MLLWSEEFETGHSLIDTHHRMLIAYINRLEELARNSDPGRVDVELFLRFIEFLETYILAHFSAEENCMRRFKCPVGVENAQAHQAFLVYFQKFKLRLEIEGYRSEVVKELHESCKSWIQQHILRIDVQLKPCLNQISEPEEEPE
jgi:hemerythrin